MGYSLAEISARFGGEILGDAATRIEGVGTLQNANADEITFLANSKYRELLAETRAAAVIVGEDARESTLLPRIVAANPYAYFAKLAQLLRPKQDLAPGVHPSALVEASAVVAASAHIGPFAYVGAEAKIGENAAIGAHCSIGARVQIGADSLIHPNVAIYADCILGARAVVHSGAVIGADGFGIAFEGEHWIKIPQTGRVVIGDDVEIGANTTIDRGAIDDTVLEDGVKLDNQIQIGHNVRVGAHTAIAGCVGVAGSAQIGRYCRIGGAAGVVGHISICDNVTVSAFTLVTKSIARPGSYSGALPQLPHRDWLAQMAQLRRLHQLAQHVLQLEQRLAELERGKT